MSVATYTKTGNKATTAAKLDKKVFGVEVSNHELLKQAYLTHLANSRDNLAVVKRRGQVSGGGKKPWRQKGTGRARFGSSRNPIWRGGGIVFGPTGEENYEKKMTTKSKRLAIRQALTLASEANKVKVIESVTGLDGKTKDLAKLLNKIEATGNVLLVVAEKDASKEKAARNIQGLKVVSGKYLTVFDVLNARSIVVEQKALEVINQWLADSKVTAKSLDKPVVKETK